MIWWFGITAVFISISIQECHCASHQMDYFEHMAAMQEPTCTCGSIECESGNSQQPSFVSSTLPKPLKGILKNSSNMIGSFSVNGSFPGMSYTLPRDFDVMPFDTMPPCDDCLQKARYQGSYSGDCTREECALGSRSNQASPANTLKRNSSLRSIALTPPEMFATQLTNLKLTTSQESLGHPPSKEIVETVESSV